MLSPIFLTPVDWAESYISLIFSSVNVGLIQCSTGSNAALYSIGSIAERECVVKLSIKNPPFVLSFPAESRTWKCFVSNVSMTFFVLQIILIENMFY